MSFKILIIDDEAPIREHFTTLLSENGYEYVEAENGEEGIQKFKEVEPDLVLLDVNMPGKSGLEILKELKSIKKCTPVFLLTSQESHKRSFASLYADEFIPKDKKSEILISRIKLHLEEMPGCVEKEDEEQH